MFDANGTHQFTTSLVTGDYMYNFSYRSVVEAVEHPENNPVCNVHTSDTFHSSVSLSYALYKSLAMKRMLLR